MPRETRLPCRLAAFLAAALSLWACSSAASDPEAAAPEPACPGGECATYDDIVGVSYYPAATDEGLLTLLNTYPVATAAAEPVITAPAQQSELHAPTTFAYEPRATAARDAAASATRRSFALAGPAPRRPFTLGELVPRRLASELRALFTLEGVAYAHGAPMNGEAFLLAFSTREDATFLRVFLQARSYTPSDAEWLRLAGAHDEVTLTVTRAIYEEGRLTADGGPFVGAALHFTITP